MNVFVLCAGRTASTTFANISEQIPGYSAGHETRATLIGEQRLNYKSNHIEVDNRLAWFLGSLDKKYGDAALYVYIKREPQKIADSYFKRWYLKVSIVKAFGYGILMKSKIGKSERKAICDFYVETVENNIEHFLKDKTNVLVFNLENAKQDYSKFLEILSVSERELLIDMWDSYHNLNKELSLKDKLYRIFNRLKNGVSERWS